MRANENSRDHAQQQASIIVVLWVRELKVLSAGDERLDNFVWERLLHFHNHNVRGLSVLMKAVGRWRVPRCYHNSVRQLWNSRRPIRIRRRRGWPITRLALADDGPEVYSNGWRLCESSEDVDAVEPCEVWLRDKLQKAMETRGGRATIPKKGLPQDRIACMYI